MFAFLRHVTWPAFAAAAAVIAITLAIARARRTHAARARVRAALDTAPTPTEAWREGDEVTVRGTLRADRPIVGLALIGFAGREQVELAPGAGENAFVGDVALADPIAIVVGSHVVRHHEMPPDHFEAASVARAKIRRATELHVWRGGVDGYHVRRVKPGDEVLARGRLARHHDGWRLEQVQLAALPGVVDPVQLPPQSAMGQAVVFGAAAFVAVAYLMARW